jgi:5-methylcytosine-specific restriction endonuclease McrA
MTVHRACLICSRPFVPTGPGQSRCPLHEKRAVPRDRRYRALANAVIAAATTCAICGEPPRADDPFVVDHITPRAHGGTDDPTNLQATHRSCNARKGATPTTTNRYGGGGLPIVKSKRPAATPPSLPGFFRLRTFFRTWKTR